MIIILFLHLDINNLNEEHERNRFENNDSSRARK